VGTDSGSGKSASPALILAISLANRVTSSPDGYPTTLDSKSAYKKAGMKEYINCLTNRSVF